MTTVHVVSHTHWDREWYRKFQYFRTKLVFAIDRILTTLENDPSFEFYLLDGQTIVLDDYLQVKPENYGRLKSLIESGRLIVGPWYVQPDEFAPDGESLVRNLLIGMNDAQKMGGGMRVGYLPDSFGQTGQLPQILKGFGIDSAVMMRGVPANLLKRTEFIWEGINGEQVLGIYLPHGYSNGMFMPENAVKAGLRFKEVVGRMKKWSKTGNVLVMNGVDHQFIQPSIPENIKAVNKVSLNTKYELSSIKNYIDNVQKSASDLPVLKHDLLAPDKHRVHSSIASTRIYQKQENRRIESLLERFVEPIASIAWLNGAEYPYGLIRQAWKILLQNQTHDGIGGCCTDEVHREMDQRFVDTNEIGQTLLKSFSRAIARRIDADQLMLTVFNNTFQKGKQFINATLYVKDENFILRDLSGKDIAYEIQTIEDFDASEVTIWTLYLGVEEPYKKIEISFELDFDFNIGYRILNVLEGEQNNSVNEKMAIQDHHYENDYYQLQILDNGSINFFDKESEQLYTGLGVFEDCGDAGDTYNYSPVKNDTIITSELCEAKISLIKKGVQSSIFEINLEMDVPISLAKGDQNRSDETGKLPIKSCLTVYKDSKRIDFRTEIDNQIDYHRLRVLFPVNFLANESIAETQFGSVRRDVKIDTTNWQKEKWTEKPLPIYSMQKYVTVSSGKSGLTILNLGLPEYEFYQSETTTVAITLLRGVGMLGKEDLLIRPGRPSGIIVPTPDAQCHGKQVVEYAIYPSNGPVDESEIAQEAAKFDSQNLVVQSCIKMPTIQKKRGPFLSMVKLETLTSYVSDQLEDIPCSDFELVKLSSENLLISAVKLAEMEEALIVRLYNATDTSVNGAFIKIGVDCTNAWRVNMLEEVIEELKVESENKFELPSIEKYSVLTIKFNCTRG